jgi:Secretion system C-terminal sorting domain/Carboxypeptidase regulatory-like domain
MRNALLFAVVTLLLATGVFASTVSKELVYQTIDKYEAGYSLTASETLMLEDVGYTFETPVIDEAGGPDGFGYVWKDNDEPDGPTYSWVDISGTGTNIASQLSDDSQAGPFPIGFSFNYYGTTYTDFYIHSNGIVSLTAIPTAPWTNAALPGTFTGPVICWYWDDFNVSNGADGDIYYETVTIGDQNALVMSYVNCGHFGITAFMTGQMILFDDSRIITQYDAFDLTWPLDSATIGLRNTDGSIFLQADFDALIPNYPDAGVAMEFSVVPGEADAMGTVTDAVTGDPIPGVSVQFPTQSGITDGNGTYSFTGLFVGDNAVTLTMDGYDTVNTMVFLDPGMNDYDFEMDPQYFLDIEPLSGTTVPPNGGNVIYAAQLTNPTPFASLMTGWTWAGMPDGVSIYGPILQAPLNIQPGVTTVPQLALQVPSYAPSGVYTYHAAIGEFPNIIYSEDFFYFWKFAPGVGEGEWSDTPWDQAIAGTADAIVMPESYEVAKVYPNPFNPTATVEISLPEVSDLKVRVYNVTGQMVSELANGQFNAGSHNLTIDGSALASGVYFVHTQVPGQVNNMQKITLLK